MAARPFAATRQRKLIFLGLILLLFFGLMVHRRVLQASAIENSLQANNLGDVDLGGSITRFVLASFRGPLVCGLWWEARNAQARHDFEQMELVIRALTKLQPHFKEPWKYEAWNLAYNVAVEFDAIKDKYFYVTEGIRWLVEGERTNRARIFDGAKLVEVGDPRMREDIAYYTQDKMMVSDENQIYRILLHFSCIPPERRDPGRLKSNPREMAEFKEAYPQLMRRIQEYRYVPEGSADVLERELLKLLTDYPDIPALYPSPSDVRVGRSEPSKPFPLWPEEHRPANPSVELNQNTFNISIPWYEFALEPLPPTPWEVKAGMPLKDPRLIRMHSGKDELIFRANPARSKSLQAREYGKDGWDDLAQEAWVQAHEMWLKFGQANGLERPWEELDVLRMRGNLYYMQYPEYAGPGKPPPEYLRDNPELHERVTKSYLAFLELKALMSARSACRYDYWLLTAETCRSDDFRQASRYWHQASQSRSDLEIAIRDYDASMRYWRKLLVESRPLPTIESMGFRIHQACLPGIASTLALLDFKAVQPSQYGAEEQVQEELVRLEDEMLRTKARYRGGDVLLGHSPLWLIREMSASFLQAPAAGTPAVWLVIPPRGLSIDVIEDGIERQAGAFEEYVLPSIRLRMSTRDRQLNRAPRTDVTPEMLKPKQAEPDETIPVPPR
ncbi:MAG TPA: hypothetical protein PKC45_02470 [Gemmatales bacterium]|nr:hypothetical protein [Gemmatales bacterium]